MNASHEAVASICAACGTQYPPASQPPSACAICEDSRQYVPRSGQSWTTLEQLRVKHRNMFQQLAPGLIAIGTTPDFAIGQRAILLRSEEGNWLWDCIPHLDEATIELVRALGGLRGIAISHPHYYSTMTEWSRAFGDVPIYLHAADGEWVMRGSDAIEFWDGEQKELAPSLTLVRCGGHFAGGTVLHWAAGADGRGTLLVGDILQVTPDRMVSFMYSYPNLIPLPAREVQAIGDALKPFAFDAMYGAFWPQNVANGAQSIIAESVARYVRAVTPGA